MDMLTKDGFTVCPHCHQGSVRRVDGEGYICQGACGFRSASPEPLVWFVLAQLIKRATALADDIKFAEGTIPNSNITEDFLRFKDHYEIEL